MRGALAALRGHSLAQAQARGTALGTALWHLDRRWRPLAEAQIAMALPELDARTTIRNNYRHYGAMLAELAAFEHVLAAGPDLFEVHHRERFAPLKQGGLLITGHIGNWETLALAHTPYYGRVTALVKPIGNPYIDRWINHLRARTGVDTLYTRDNALTARRLLKEGAQLVALLDQNSLQHEGLYVDFFGRPACTHYGPAMLALMTNRPVITGFSFRRPDGRFDVVYDEPLEMPPGRDLRERTWLLTAAITARIEAAVRRHPEQWFWIHRRWRNQPKPDSEPWRLPPRLRPSSTVRTMAESE